MQGRKKQFKRRVQRKQVAILANVPNKPSVKSLDRRIKKINNKFELKHIDTFNNGTAITAGALLIPLNLCVQGDTDITRTGDDSSATSIQWRLRISTDVDSLTDVIVRMLIVWDRQANGAVFTIGQLLDNSVITSLILSPYNHSNQERFKILHDSVHVMKPQVLLDFDTTTGTTSTNQIVSKYLRGKRQLSRTVKYEGNVGTIADIESNALYAVFVSNTATEDPTLASGFRFYFKDA